MSTRMDTSLAVALIYTEEKMTTVGLQRRTEFAFGHIRYSKKSSELHYCITRHHTWRCKLSSRLQTLPKCWRPRSDEVNRTTWLAVKSRETTISDPLRPWRSPESTTALDFLLRKQTQLSFQVIHRLICNHGSNKILCPEGGSVVSREDWMVTFHPPLASFQR